MCILQLTTRQEKHIDAYKHTTSARGSLSRRKHSPLTTVCTHGYQAQNQAKIEDIYWPVGCCFSRCSTQANQLPTGKTRCVNFFSDAFVPTGPRPAQCPDSPAAPRTPRTASLHRRRSTVTPSTGGFSSKTLFGGLASHAKAWITAADTLGHRYDMLYFVLAKNCRASLREKEKRTKMAGQVNAQIALLAAAQNLGPRHLRAWTDTRAVVV